MTISSRLRRARSLLCLWEEGDLILHNYLTNARVVIAPELIPPLSCFGEYAERNEIEDRLGLGETGVEVINRLLEHDVLVAEGSAVAARDELLDRSWAWGHDARALHFSTQSLRFEYDAEAEERRLTRLAAHEPPPDPYKHLAEDGIPLEPMEGEGGLWAALGNRRTRRNFRREAVTLSELSTVLGWTWGRTHERDSPLLGRYLLKTSPSGGARHSIEVYPLVLRVDDVPQGLYHYSVARHDLELLRTGDFEELAVELCGSQGWVQNAAVIFFMTAVLNRSMWKYKHSHAYRVLHLDAGHLGQTFHLVCTELGLAPFSTTATNGADIEAVLGLDGITEIALYTAATGYPEQVG